MVTKPMPIRIDTEVQRLLQEGVRRTPHKKQELIRLTLRRHLRTVIEQETTQDARPLTNIKPWPKKEIEAAYRRAGAEWDKVEELGTRAQGKVHFDD